MQLRYTCQNPLPLTARVPKPLAYSEHTIARINISFKLISKMFL